MLFRLIVSFFLPTVFFFLDIFFSSLFKLPFFIGVLCSTSLGLFFLSPWYFLIFPVALFSAQLFLLQGFLGWFWVGTLVFLGAVRLVLSHTEQKTALVLVSTGLLYYSQIYSLQAVLGCFWPVLFYTSTLIAVTLFAVYFSLKWLPAAKQGNRL